MYECHSAGSPWQATMALPGSEVPGLLDGWPVPEGLAGCWAAGVSSRCCSSTRGQVCMLCLTCSGKLNSRVLSWFALRPVYTLHTSPWPPMRSPTAPVTRPPTPSHTRACIIAIGKGQGSCAASLTAHEDLQMHASPLKVIWFHNTIQGRQMLHLLRGHLHEVKACIAKHPTDKRGIANQIAGQQCVI